ncbi:peptidylprolyl isomerase [uncultured Alistipes sp.]|uniref:peptidylprolyl isomerase n=1 Tax=uncultured Alistipes sp. TaxID=538949 RepID=UPI00260481EC|nr:peptidylprolyl isomerase [uncultured Alistipes sp.]
MVKKSILFAALALTVTGAMAQERQVMLDKVVAVVGSSSILYSEVESYANQLVQQRREAGYTSDRDPMNESLEALLTQKLLYNQALIDSVEINQGAIVSAVEEQVQQMIDMEGSISKLEARHHMPIFNIREIMRQRYEEQNYAQEMQRTVVSKVSVIPGEVERYYKSISKDSLPVIADQLVYAQITKFPKSMTAAKQRTRERLVDMRERVISGQAKFENLARMYSQDGTAMRGGEMDPTPLAQLDQAFAKALEALKPGQVSEVVESQYGFHIIQLLDQHGQLYHFRHILLRPVYTSEELGESLDLLDSLANQIRIDSITFEKAALEYSDDASSKMNGGIVSNHDILEQYSPMDAASLTVTKFLKEDFGRFKSLEDYNALMRLKPGEVSSAFLAEDMLGNQMAKIVKLVEVIPTHTASLNDDYLRLEEMALADKQDRVFREWLTKKIDAMYVYIIPEFRDGEFENKHWVK